MGKQYRTKRRTHQINLTENNVSTWDIPRGYDIESIWLRLSGTANITTAGTAVRQMAPTQLIKRVELIADGKNTIFSVPGWKLVKNYSRPNCGFMTPPTAASIAAYSVGMFGVIDQALIDGIRPKDSNLRTSGMQQLQLRITTGAATDLLTGSPAGTMTAFALDIGVVETVEMADEKGAITAPLYLQKRSYQDISIPASNANQQIVLPIGNALRGVEILATVNGEPSNSVLNNIQLASGLDVRVNINAPALQALNQMDNTNIGLLSNTTNNYVSSQMPTGFYLVDLMNNGGHDVQVTNAWDLTQASEAKLVLDVTGGAGYALTVITTEFIA